MDATHHMDNEKITNGLRRRFKTIFPEATDDQLDAVMEDADVEIWGASMRLAVDIKKNRERISLEIEKENGAEAEAHAADLREGKSLSEAGNKLQTWLHNQLTHYYMQGLRDGAKAYDLPFQAVDRYVHAAAATLAREPARIVKVCSKETSASMLLEAIKWAYFTGYSSAWVEKVWFPSPDLCSTG